MSPRCVARQLVRQLAQAAQRRALPAVATAGSGLHLLRAVSTSAASHAPASFAWLRHKLAAMLLAKAPAAGRAVGTGLLMSTAVAALWGQPQAADRGGSTAPGAAAHAHASGSGSGDATTPSGSGSGTGTGPWSFMPFRWSTDSPMPRGTDLAQANAAFGALLRDPLYQWTSVEAGSPAGRVACGRSGSGGGGQGESDRALSDFAAVSSRPLSQAAPSPSPSPAGVYAGGAGTGAGAAAAGDDDDALLAFASAAGKGV
ncbi:hypothetical protein FOA52_007679 [Chlamydomonas sp. UWO 241]|nr:hypothetical protein FOA52_007679 [Chlamydomonas sp. UWO 241]